MDYNIIGEQIRTQRKLLGFTQEQLAEKCSISASFMGHIERGTRTLSLETLYKLCIALHMSADGLLGLSAPLLDNERKNLALTHLYSAIDIIK